MSAVLGVPKGKGAPFSKRKLEVLRAAAKLFNEKGFHNTTMDDIAAALKVTKPALYYYAKSKDQILYQVGGIALSNTTETLTSLDQHPGNNAQRLQAFFESWTESVCHEFGRCLVLSKPENLEPDSRELNKKRRREVQQAIIDLIEGGIAEGSIKSCNSALTAQALFDLFNGIAYWYKPSGKLTPNQIAKQYWLNFGLGFLNPNP